MIRKDFRNALLVASTSAIAFVQPGCDGTAQTHYAGGPAMSLPVPTALQRTTLSKSAMSASLSVDGGSPQAMTISGNTASWSGARPDGEASYAVTISYSASGTETTLVTAQKSSSSGTVTFTEADFTYTDSDGDGYTNLRELEAGSGPRSSGSIPDDLDDNYEDNDSPGTAYDLSAFQNQWISLLSTGAGYLTENDTVDFFVIDLRTDTPATLTLEVLCNTDNMLGGIGYYDSDNEFYIESDPNKDYCDNDESDPLTWTVSDVQAERYYVLMSAFDENGNVIGVNGAYTLRWY
ncbi:hypothetical protein Q4485_13950 [Granulosicoccaceae sp. 1_MG-2023]|nr:hypothetical protein [Granulosicoccaceae sp. 1_MG-2023]